MDVPSSSKLHVRGGTATGGTGNGDTRQVPSGLRLRNGVCPYAAEMELDVEWIFGGRMGEREAEWLLRCHLRGEV